MFPDFILGYLKVCAFFPHHFKKKRKGFKRNSKEFFSMAKESFFEN